MKILTYDKSMQRGWDDFVSSSRNGTFLFQRSFMDYHSDRFEDCSLIVTDSKDNWLAILPASKSCETVSSHAGLTYGGFVFGQNMTGRLMLEVFSETRLMLRQLGVSRIVYKTVPYIYHKYPSGEDRYALFRCGAHLTRVDLAFTVPRLQRFPLHQLRSRGVKKAQRASLQAKESDSWSEFHELLSENLASRHRTKPVHSLAELLHLKANFPKNIRLFVASDSVGIIAGVVIFETEKVAHVQYIASNEAGRNCGALDLVFVWLLTEVYGEKDFFDFGISTEKEGRYLNEGLASQKEGFGARGVPYETFCWNILDETPIV